MSHLLKDPKTLIPTTSDYKIPEDQLKRGIDLLGKLSALNPQACKTGEQSNTPNGDVSSVVDNVIELTEANIPPKREQHYNWYYSSPFPFPNLPTKERILRYYNYQGYYASLGIDAEHRGIDDKSVIPLFCSNCGTTNPKMKCVGCNTAYYCCKECQVLDWKGVSKGGGGHKLNCETYKLLGGQMTFKNEVDGLTVGGELGVIRRCRMYTFPYTYIKESKLGNEFKGTGFLFIQSASTLAELALPGKPRDTAFPTHGNDVKLKVTAEDADEMKVSESRSISAHFLTLGEFEKEVLPKNLSLSVILEPIKLALEEYTEDVEDKLGSILVVIRTRCGFLGVVRCKGFMDKSLMMDLGKDYEAMEELLLNIDDV